MGYISWIAPMPGQYKLNTDGAAKNNPCGEVLSGIIRDSNANWEVGLSKCIPFSSNTFGILFTTNIIAAISAVLRGLQITLQYGLHQLIIGIDSQEAIKLSLKTTCML